MLFAHESSSWSTIRLFTVSSVMTTVMSERSRQPAGTLAHPRVAVVQVCCACMGVRAAHESPSGASECEADGAHQQSPLLRTSEPRR